MKKLIFLAVFCLLASASHVNAQLIIRNSGHAEIGANPMTHDLDTATVLKIFGDETANGAGGHITFGDSAYVAFGEYGNTNTNQLWLHGKKGAYITTGSANPLTILAYYDPQEDNKFHFNCDVTSSGFFVLSDERFKENIEPVGEVLSSLQNLEPVTYDLKSALPVGRLQNNAQDGSGRYGFLAQNVKDVFPELVHADSKGYMSVDYIGLIPILVQSINELRAELAELKQESAGSSNASLQTASEAESRLDAAKLYQNTPNPWNSETVIRYSLPRNVAKAAIYIYDLQGQQLKSIPAEGRGESQVTVTARDLKAGMYLYALVADGALVDSKKMILTK